MIVIIERRGLPAMDVITISPWNYNIDNELGCIPNYANYESGLFYLLSFLDEQVTAPSLYFSLLLGFSETVAYNTNGWVIRRLRWWMIGKSVTEVLITVQLW